MGHITAIANQKGGVGKTTTAINLSAALAILEYRVLLIDLDPQANATTGLGVAATAEANIYRCISGQKRLTDIICSTETPNLDLAPSHIDLVGAEIELPDVEEREYRLARLLEDVRDRYDYIFIDCSPSLGILTVNALTAADRVLIPIQCEIFALEGLSKLFHTIEIIRNAYNPHLEVDGVLLSMYDKRLRLAKMISEKIRSGVKEYVYETVIYRNSKITEAPSLGQPVLMYDAACRGSDNFLQLAGEFLRRNPVPSTSMVSQ